MRRLSTFLFVIPLLGAMAAPAAAQAPTTTEELLAGMVTEEIEPGVYKVVNDGSRDVSHRDENSWLDDAVLVGDVGDVWRITPPRRLFKLGHEAEWNYDPGLVGIGQANTEAMPDGGLVTIGAVGLKSFDGRSWSEGEFGFGGNLFKALATQADGTVWLLSEDGLTWLPPSSPPEYSSWEDVYDPACMPQLLSVADAGEAWLMGMQAHDESVRCVADVFLRFDGNGWEAVPVPEGIETARLGRPFDVGPDGTLWTTGDSLHVHQSLARLDGGDWTIFTAADGVRPWGEQPMGWFPTDLVGVAPDGSAWVNATDETTDRCDGLARFDGETWTPYLAGRCISDFDFAPDGSVWVVTHEPDRRSAVDTYVITPEAVAIAPDGSISQVATCGESLSMVTLEVGDLLEKQGLELSAVISDGYGPHPPPELIELVIGKATMEATGSGCYQPGMLNLAIAIGEPPCSWPWGPVCGEDAGLSSSRVYYHCDTSFEVQPDEDVWISAGPVPEFGDPSQNGACPVWSLVHRPS